MRVLFMLVMAWRLTFTVPTHLTNGDTLTDYSHVKLFKCHQSATWVAMRPAMLIDTLVWKRFWPSVIIEAAPVWYGDYIDSPIILPDTMALNQNYYLVVVRKSGPVSLPSNWAVR